MPGFIVCELGVTDIVKSAAGVIVRSAVVVRVIPELVAVIVRCEVPEGVVVVVKTLSVREPLISKPGLNAASTPAGRPVTPRTTAPITAGGSTETVKLAPLPATTLCEPGEAESEKSMPWISGLPNELPMHPARPISKNVPSPAPIRRDIG